MPHLHQLMIEHGLDADARAKVVRHADNRAGMDVLALERDGWLETYQSYQASRIFDCDVVVVYIGEGKLETRFFGVYRVVNDAKPTPLGILPQGFPHQNFDSPGVYYYAMERCDDFDFLDAYTLVWDALPKNYHLWVARDGKCEREMNVHFVGIPGASSPDQTTKR